MKTKVIFRKWKPSEGGGILALFPEIPASCLSWLDCQSYEIVGQHGPANYDHCIKNTVPATPSEFKAIKQELENHCGYELIVKKRASRKMHQTRRDSYKR